MSISINDLIHIVETVLGCERGKGGDHVRYFLKVNGRTIGSLKYSHSWRGNYQIDDTILALQARSMQCSPKTWKQLLQGRVTGEAYFRELLEQELSIRQNLILFVKEGKGCSFYTELHRLLCCTVSSQLWYVVESEH